jgi:hypothetical protein
MGYAEFSEQKRAEKELRDVSSLDRRITDIHEVNLLLTSQRVQLGDIEDIFACDKLEARNIISMFRKANAIKKVAYYYKKTPPFIQYLKIRRKDIVYGKEEIQDDIAAPYDGGVENPFA